MKKLVILIVLIIAPLAATSQNTADVIVEDAATVISLDTNTATADVSNKRNHTYFASQAEAVKLNYKKSIDLISIKAFRKASQLRSKQTRRC